MNVTTKLELRLHEHTQIVANADCREDTINSLARRLATYFFTFTVTLYLFIYIYIYI